MNPESLAVILLVTDVLEAYQIDYVIGGSMASIVYGTARATMDVDIVAEVNLGHVSGLVAAWEGQFYLDEGAIRQAIERRSSFSLIHLATMFKVDIFLSQPRAFDKQQLSRRVPGRIMPNMDKTVWLLTAEDIILAKLDWFRLGGEVSERQWRDILGILKTQQGHLDIPYLLDWSQHLQLSDLFNKALRALEGE